MGACPTHIDVPRFIKKIASGNVMGSAKSILEANVLGASCSRVCPVEVLCEGSCVMHGRGEKPIEIGRLQRFAMETFYEAGGKLPLRKRPERTQRVACIGAGPASLACAAELRQQGFQVTIFDKRPLPGGLNTYGVAEYKLRTPDSLREVEMIRAPRRAVRDPRCRCSRAGTNGARVRCDLPRRRPRRDASTGGRGRGGACERRSRNPRRGRNHRRAGVYSRRTRPASGSAWRRAS